MGVLTMPIRVLLVDDDSDFRDSLQTYLTDAGLAVRALGDTLQLAREIEDHRPDVVVLDLNLPGQDGFSAALAMRDKNALGIVMLTGRTKREDRVLGLSIGVDHYLTKPIDPAELELVLRNLHRRLKPAAPAAATDGAETGRWVFNARQWLLTSPAGIEIKLSSTEYQLLERLVARQGKPVPRTDLIADADRHNPDEIGRGLDLIVFRLRRKVEKESGAALPVRSVRGVGYVFADKVELVAD